MHPEYVLAAAVPFFAAHACIRPFFQSKLRQDGLTWVEAGTGILRLDALDVETAEDSSLVVQGTDFRAPFTLDHQHEAYRVHVSAGRLGARKSRQVRTLTPRALQGQGSVEFFNVGDGLLLLGIEGRLEAIEILVHNATVIQAEPPVHAAHRRGAARSIKGRADFQTNIWPTAPKSSSRASSMPEGACIIRRRRECSIPS